MIRKPIHNAAIILCMLSLSLAARLEAAQPQQQAEEQKYLRFVEDDEGGGKLETAIISYRNDQGVVVHLVSVVHVGERDYYRDLAKTFEGYDALLYEMVKPKDAGPPGADFQSQSMVTVFQRFLKDVLKLEFQLDAIDYSARNFIHADLDAETFARLQRERGESLIMLMFRQVMHEMQNPRENQAAQITLPELIVALTSPDKDRHLKLILARQFEDLERQVAGIEGPGGSVILTERNKKAIEVLEQTIAAGRKNIGVFYGAAHMIDLHQRLLGMGFKPTGTEWRTAWDMTPREGDVIIRVHRKKPVAN
jgi:hypothetical protein